MGWREITDRHDGLTRELAEERLGALLRISRTLESLIAQLHAARERLARLPDADRARELPAYRELHARALEYRWFLEVQREALGLRHHHRLDEFYAIPPLDV
jgi:hypothetical protein